MIELVEGTIFSTNAKTLVNTVNCVGALGKGIALEFNLRYENLEKDYKDKCDSGQLKIGRPTVFEVNDEKWILNFPTKNHWRYPSKLEWIEESLKYFVKHHKSRAFESIAFPKLGCGNGKLSWNDVQPLMMKYLSQVDMKVYICLGNTLHVDDVENAMVTWVNDKNIESLTTYTKLSVSCLNKLIIDRPFTKFRDIQNVNGVGKKQYIQLFRSIYNIVQSGEKAQSDIEVQLNLFDNN